MTQQPPLWQRIGMLPAMTAMSIARKMGLGAQVMRLLSRMMHSPRQKRKAFAGYRPARHDVFVCAYSKSGTNWAMQIAQQIACYGKAEFEHIHDLVAWPDVPLPVPVVALWDPTPRQQAPTGLRVIKTHLESSYVPYSADARYLIVIRDPKDVFVSSYYFGRNVLQAAGLDFSPREWLEQFLSDHFFFGSWAAHTASYWPWRLRKNVLLLTLIDAAQQAAIDRFCRAELHRLGSDVPYGENFAQTLLSALASDRAMD